MPIPQNLKPGMKVGPDQDDFRKLDESGAKYAEVWYRVDQESRYDALFAHMKVRGIQAGLHFWGTLDNDILPNLAYPDERIWRPSIELMKHNVDVAAKHAFYYVNVHLGNAALEQISLDKYWMRPVPDTLVEVEQAQETFEKNVLELNAYARNAGVQLIVETIPPSAPENWSDNNARLQPHDTHSLSNTFLEEIAKKHHLALNNDISHTAAELITDNRAQLWTYLHERTTALAPFTKLIHCNTLAEPFNGTDSHDGILDTDFAHNVFPTRTQLRELLHTLVGSNEVWIVCEPKRDHIENYRALVQLLAELS